jgi:hypothetical protein
MNNKRKMKKKCQKILPLGLPNMHDPRVPSPALGREKKFADFFASCGVHTSNPCTREVKQEDLEFKASFAYSETLSGKKIPFKLGLKPSGFH